jgi:hypothetical protein
MKVKRELLLQVLGENAMTIKDLARALDVRTSEIERLLDGEAVGEATAREFIYYFGADEAGRLIDWEAVGKKNPLDRNGEHGADGEGSDEK